MFGIKLVTTVALVFATVAMASVATDVPNITASTSFTTVSYGSNPYETVNVYPAAAPGSRMVILVHGGGWASTEGSYGNTPSVASQLQAAGFTVFNVNYDTDSLTTSAFPTETADVYQATLWAISNAIQYNGDSTNVSLLGLSSGGELVAWVAEMLPPGTVSAVVTLSGAFDFTRLVPDRLNGSTTAALSFRAAVALGCRLATCTPATEGQYSPASHVSSTNCPGTWLIYNSANELMPLDQPTAMASALQANGCNVTETILPGSLHAWDYWNAVSSAVIATIQASG